MPVKWRLKWKKSLSFTEGAYTLSCYVFGPCLMVSKSTIATAPTKFWFLFDGLRFSTEQKLIKYLDERAGK
jgi:hypothetical protein